MASFCPDCGKPLPNQNIKFCPECGCSLFVFSQINDDKPLQEDSPETKKSQPGLTTKDLGAEFEKFVERLLIADGYKTERNVWINGSRGSQWEIDILASKVIDGREVKRAVECKNHQSAVSRERMIYFATKLEETGLKNGLFAVYYGITEDGRRIAREEGIEVWERDEILERLLDLEVGRGSRANENHFELAVLPVMKFEDVIRLPLKNAGCVKIEKARLIWRPYYRVRYRLDAVRSLSNGETRKINDDGFCVIDCLDGTDSFIQNSNGSIRSGNGGFLGMFHESDQEREAISRSLSGNLVRDYRTDSRSEYQIDAHHPLVSKREAWRIAVNTITEVNRHEMKYRVRGRNGQTYARSREFVAWPKEIFLDQIEAIYVPSWEIEFNSFGRVYSRTIIGTTFLEDTISACSSHTTLIGLGTKWAQSMAVCEVCGDALCEKHIFQCPVCKKWICRSHSIECTTCGQRYCQEHITNYCQMCSSPTCHNCIKTCKICGRLMCGKHRRTCDNCSALACPDCVTSKGLIVKNHTCIKCKPKTG